MQRSITADFTNKDDIENLLQKLTDIDILINNVGIFEMEEFQNIEDKDWYKYFEINVMSFVRLSRKLLPRMQDEIWGRIIFISSKSGVNVPENMIHYGMTKAAISARQMDYLN
ncbi:SDR family NAD(P)-dependent oxidoreductase [Flavobacterium sp. TMP13]|uniref:SDR family NAD(P)-dependent oxidoreductase n=1 Tax=Flavobacterium sp. TMP13 TaxID=3425950 RepID=UPI003D77243C